MEERLLAYHVLCFNWHVNSSNKDGFTHMVDTCQSRKRWGRNRLCRGTCHGSRGSPVGGGEATSSSQNHIGYAMHSLFLVAMVTGSSRGTWGESTKIPGPAQLSIAASDRKLGRAWEREMMNFFFFPHIHSPHNFVTLPKADVSA